MHRFHDSSHGFWRPFTISLNYFRSKRQSYQREHHDDQRRFWSRPDYEEHVDMREPTHDAFVRTHRKARSVPRKDRKNIVIITRSITIDHHHHQIEDMKGITTRSIIDTDILGTPEDTDQGREAVAHKRDEPTHGHQTAYRHGHHRKREGLLSRVVVIVSGQFSSPSSSLPRHHHSHREHRSPAPPPPSTSRRSTRRLRRRRTRPPEHNEERDDSFDIRRGTGLPNPDPIRDDSPVVDPPANNAGTEPANLDNEIIVELAELDDNPPNRDLPRDTLSEAEPLINNVGNADPHSPGDEIGVIELSDRDDDDEPDEIVVELSSQQDGGKPYQPPDTSIARSQQPRYNNPPSPSLPPSTPPSLSSPSSSSAPSTPSTTTTTTQYTTTGGPSAWADLPAPSRRILARYAIPRDASFAHWDGATRPFAVWSSVFDAASLGAWIYGWAAAHHGRDGGLLAAVDRFRATLARLGRNVSAAAAQGQGRRQRVRDGAELLDDVEALVRVCQDRMVGRRERERYYARRRRHADDGKIPKLGPGATRAFVDALLNRADFWDIEEAARAWNRWFARWGHKGGGGDEEYEVFLRARERL
ncbi:hypothetical protein F4809DRAFT_666406 [Biscogniauxia mediterranea]|nr:hypothetical protein F4809DRAFT_666406 [Biscogniauxia mediterranea]